MSREEIQKLLGGYATGTLTPEEREALFAAALEDQELFDALAREQPLHDLLREPAARAHLLAALEERPAPWYGAWWRPAAAALAMAGMALVAVLVFRGKPHIPQPVEVAQVQSVESVKPAPAPPPAAADKPAPLPARPRPRVFHAPAPTAAPPRQQAEVAPPPEVISPKLEAQPLPVAPPPPQVALGFRNQAGVVGGVPATPPPDARAMFYTRQEAAKEVANDAAATESKPTEGRTMARVAGNAMTMRAAAEGYTARLGVRYTILRKQPNGEFDAADPENLQKGDVLRLRFQPNESGYLSVTALNGSRAPRVVASGFVSQMAQFTTPVLQPDVTDLQVSFSRRQLAVGTGVAGTSVETSSDASQRATYVVGANNLQIVIFPVKLNYR